MDSDTIPYNERHLHEKVEHDEGDQEEEQQTVGDAQPTPTLGPLDVKWNGEGGVGPQNNGKDLIKQDMGAVKGLRDHLLRDRRPSAGSLRLLYTSYAMHCGLPGIIWKKKSDL